MDTVAPALPVSALRSHLGTAQAPLVLDVRRAEALAQDDGLIAGATWRDPFAVQEWARFVPRHRPVVVYCVHGHEISRNTAQALRAAGIDASYLDGGIEAWRAAKAPTTRKSSAPAIPSAPNAPSTWVTRERPKIDRIACPWLIRRFIDPFAEFQYVAADAVAATAQARGWIPYDIPHVRFTHRGERCSFDALVDDFGIDDAALHRLALIVRGADTGQPHLAPQCAGLVALSLGLSATFADDHAMLQHGLVMYDALYAWCRQEEAGTAERHTWKAPA